MAISNKLTTVASGVKNIRTALKEIDSNFGAGHISTLDDEIRQIGSNSAFVLYKDGEGNYRTKLCTSVNSIKSSVSGDIIAIILPENVDEIVRACLSSLTSLEFINLQNITYFNALSFSNNTITIDASKDLRNVEWIAGSAFSHCTGLTGELYLPKLKGFAYKNSSNLGGEASQFDHCSGLTKVMDLGSVSSINNSTFGECVNLTEVHFPETLNIISGNNAFIRDTQLSKIYFKSLESALNVDYVNDTRHPFYSTTVIPREVYINDQLLTNLVIPNTVTSIKACAFYKNTALTSVTIPNSVTSIGSAAFQNCTSLESISLPNGLLIINNSAFRDCTSLKNLTIPSTVTSINDAGIIHNCTSLVNFTNLSTASLELVKAKPLIAGDGTGTFETYGDFTRTQASGIKFHSIIIHGNLNNNATYYLSTYPGLEIIKIGGNLTASSNKGAINALMNTYGGESNLKFIEVGGTITGYPIQNGSSAAHIGSDCIFHLKYSGIACTPSQIELDRGNTRISKVYVDSQSVLNQYLADSDWAQYSSKLDLWSNYTGEYKN